jgi:hypothetical protein
MRLTVAFDLARFQRELDGQLAQMQRQARRAVNELAWRAREAVKRDMGDRAFSRPTPYILNSMMIVPALDTSTEARLDWKIGGASGATGETILRPHIEGGPRRPKRYETILRQAGILGPAEFTVVARGFPVDRYGNVPGSIITDMLSDLRAFTETGFTANRRRNAMVAFGGRRATARRYFAIRQERPGGLPRGIYREAAGDQKPLLMFRFVTAPAYRPRFAPGVIARETFLRDAPEVWRQAVAGQLPFRRLDG